MKVNGFNFCQDAQLIHRYPKGQLLFEYLININRPVTLADIKNDLGLSPSTSRNILAYLEGKSMVEVHYAPRETCPRYEYKLVGGAVISK